MASALSCAPVALAARNVHNSRIPSASVNTTSCVAARVQMPALQRVQRSQRSAAAARSVVVAAATSAERAATSPHLQLATAKLPTNVDRMAFMGQMYQWAATLTTNGRNMPFALPLKTDPLPLGFQISLLRMTADNSMQSVADLVASVEPVEGTGDVLMVRLYEGEAAAGLVLPAASAGGGGGAEQQKRLKMLLSALIDVPQIMQTMPEAIKRAVAYAR